APTTTWRWSTPIPATGGTSCRRSPAGCSSCGPACAPALTATPAAPSTTSSAAVVTASSTGSGSTGRRATSWRCRPGPGTSTPAPVQTRRSSSPLPTCPSWRRWTSTAKRPTRATATSRVSDGAPIASLTGEVRMGYSPFRPLGVTHHHPGRSYAGFTLVTTIDGDVACLVDLRGRVVHHWRLPLPAFYAYLLDDGHLLAALKIPRPAVRFGGMYGLLAELDWDGELVWQYEDPALHHDMARLRNGNTMLLRWAQIPPEIHHRVAGGQPGTEDEGGVMWGDELLEVTPAGQAVWHWKSYEVFDPQRDAMCPLEYRYEWSHCNAVEELSDGNLAVSFRRI